MAPISTTQYLPIATVFLLQAGPLPLVLAISVVVGILMVIAFRYTSNQKAIRRAKDHLKAHLLAVRLFQDQLRIVVRAYGGILQGTAAYLRLAFTPFLIAIVPVTILIVQLDRYFGWQPLKPAEQFLVQARIDDRDALNQSALLVPDGLTITAPPVHILTQKEVVWRLVADRVGRYDIKIHTAGETASKEVIVSPGLARVSPIRLRDNLWQRMFSSAESPLADDGPVQSIAVFYSPRVIRFAWMEWNWIVLFFVVSLVAGFIFKSVVGIQI